MTIILLDKEFYFCCVLCIEKCLFFYTARNILRQVIEGLMYLHSNSIIHRDLSLSNLLLTSDMKTVSTCTIKPECFCHNKWFRWTVSSKFDLLGKVANYLVLWENSQE